MTTPDQITALRAAAAKLGEALATEDYRDSSTLIITAGDLFDWDDDAPESSACFLCADEINVIDNPKGWRYLTHALRLRLLVEALLLEQGARRIPVSVDYSGGCLGCRAPEGGLHSGTCDHEICGKCHGQRIGCGCDEDEIVALVWTWWEGVKDGNEGNAGG